MAETSRRPRPTAEMLNEAVRAATAALGRPPSKRECVAHSGITEHYFRAIYPTWDAAIRAAGIEPSRKCNKVDDAKLLADWGEVVRKVGRIPTAALYRQQGRYSYATLQFRFQTWRSIRTKFRSFALGKPEWADVLSIISSFDIPPSAAPSGPPYPPLGNRPSFGNPIDLPCFRYEPTEELGVIFLFGMLATRLGYVVECIQSPFPDCTAKRQIGENRWETVRIEFELESKSFRTHGHPPDGCDIIVCWRHNWPECPKELEVVELRGIVKG